MLLALLGVLLGCFVALLWLRSLRPDGAARPLAGAPAAGSRSTSGGGGQARRVPAGTSRQRGMVHSVGLKSTAKPYAALSIKPGGNACRAATELSNLRFLQDQAPILPVEGCDCLPCDCSFQRYEDRRSNEQGERRARDEAAPSGNLDTALSDRRQLHGRRITDHS